MTGDDDDLFLDAMRGVERLDRSNPRRRASAPAAPRSKPAGRKEPPFEIDDRPDFIEGRARGVSERVAAELRGGKRAVERTIDLHGQRRDVALATVRGRIDSAARDGHRCLLFVHGRGKHSGGAPVLRDATVEALTTPPAARLVRAFCTARPEDGGAGALYVLLAKGPGKKKR